MKNSIKNTFEHLVEIYSLITTKRSKRVPTAILVFLEENPSELQEERETTCHSHRFPPTHLMRRWSPALTPCWRCFQMCRDLQTREDGDVASSTAAEKKSQSQLFGLSSRANRIKKLKKNFKRSFCVKRLSHPLGCTTLPCHMLYHKHHFPIGWSSPSILIGLTFTNTILIMTQQNASGAGHVVTGCLEVY